VIRIADLKDFGFENPLSDEEIKKVRQQGPEYHDKETNTVLKGFSQVDLDLLAKRIRENNIKLEANRKILKMLTFMVGSIFIVAFAFFAYLLWLTSYVIQHDVINNLVGACL
jgi:hypothetical protein